MASQQHPIDVTALDRRVPTFPAIRGARRAKSSIWFFDSPKNNRRLKIETDLAFMHLVLLEGDTSCIGYEFVERPLYGLPGNARPAAIVRYKDGSCEWWDFARSRAKPQASPMNAESKGSRLAAEELRAQYCVKVEEDLAGSALLFDNWLTLCAAITRCRGQFVDTELSCFNRKLGAAGAVTLGDLLGMEGIDQAIMLSVVAQALHTGAAKTNLKSQLLSRVSLITSGQA